MSDPIDRPYNETSEPSAAQTGIDAPGPRSSWADLITFGVYNGNFTAGPPDASSNLDVAGSLSSSNYLPGWRFVQSSGTKITAALVRSSTPGAGSNLRFSYGVGATTGDVAFVEQIVDIGGSAAGDVGGFFRVTGDASYTSAGTIGVAAQYLAADGSISGMPPEKTQTQNYAYLSTLKQSGYSAWSYDLSPDENAAPANARFVRYRILVSAGVGSAGSYLDIYDVRRDRAMANLRLTDRDRAGSNGLFDVYESGSNLFWQPASTTAGDTTAKRLLNHQLVGIPFSLVNLPAGATTEMQLWGDTALALGTPRIGSPWGGSIVGVSVRFSTASTGGGGNGVRFQPTLGGTSQGTFLQINTGGTGGEATQPVGGYTFAAGQQLGLQIVTTATFAPTTMDVAAILWVAIRYDGS